MEIKGVIDQLNLYNHNKIQDDKREQKTGEAKEGAAGEDKVELSPGAKMLSNIIKGAKESPDVREEKIAQIKAQIEEGSYSPNSEKIASKIWENEIDLYL